MPSCVKAAADWVAAEKVRGLFDQVPQARVESVAARPNTGTVHQSRWVYRSPSPVLASAVAICAILVGTAVYWVGTTRSSHSATASSEKTPADPNQEPVLPSDGELARIRQENSELRSRLAKLEASVNANEQSLSGKNELKRAAGRTARERSKNLNRRKRLCVHISGGSYVAGSNLIRCCT